MHVCACVCVFVYKQICLYSTGVEKENYDFRRYFPQKINRWDAATICCWLRNDRKCWGTVEEWNANTRNTIPRIGWKVGNGAARKVPRISTAPQPEAAAPPPPEPTIEENLLRKMKVVELIALLKQRPGTTISKRIRKQDVIAALMRTESRNDWDVHMMDRQSPQHHNSSFRSHQMIKRNDLYTLYAFVLQSCVIGKWFIWCVMKMDQQKKTNITNIAEAKQSQNQSMNYYITSQIECCEFQEEGFMYCVRMHLTLATPLSMSCLLGQTILRILLT